MIHRTQAYLAIMSKGDPIPVDQEELDGIAHGMGKGDVIIVKRGMINPSYLVSVVEDKKRLAEFRKECSYNSREANGKTQGENRFAKGLTPLKPIFKEDSLIGQAIEQKNQQRLKSGAKQLPKNNQT